MTKEVLDVRQLVVNAHSHVLRPITPSPSYHNNLPSSNHSQPSSSTVIFIHQTATNCFSTTNPHHVFPHHHNPHSCLDQSCAAEPIPVVERTAIVAGLSDRELEDRAFWPCIECGARCAAVAALCATLCFVEDITPIPCPVSDRSLLTFIPYKTSSIMFV